MPNENIQLIAIVAVFSAFIVFSNRRRKKAASALTDSVKLGATVVMLGGIKGKITAILDDSVIVETTPGNKIEFVKAAVRSVVAPSLDEKPKAATAAKSTTAKPVPVAKKVAAKPAATKKTTK